MQAGRPRHCKCDGKRAFIDTRTLYNESNEYSNQQTSIDANHKERQISVAQAYIDAHLQKSAAASSSKRHAHSWFVKYATFDGGACRSK